jgi:hypothetical protein
LANGSRHLVREEAVHVLYDDAKKPRRLLLFSDMVLLARKDWRDKYHLVVQATLKQIKLVDVQNGKFNPTINQLILDNESLFELEIYQGDGDSNPNRYVIQLSSESAKTQWITHLKSLLDIVIGFKEFRLEKMRRNTITSYDDDDDEHSAHATSSQDTSRSSCLTDQQRTSTPEGNSTIAASQHSFEVPSIAEEDTDQNVIDAKEENVVPDVANSIDNLKFGTGHQDDNTLTEKPMVYLAKSDSFLAQSNPVSHSLAEMQSTTSVHQTRKTSDFAPNEQTTKRLFNSMGSISNVDQATGIAVNSLRGRLRDQETQISFQTTEIERLLKKIEDMEKRNLELTEQNLSQTKTNSELQAENMKLSRAIEFSKSTQSERDLSLQQQLSDYENKVLSMKSDKTSLLNRFEQETKEHQIQYQYLERECTNRHACEIETLRRQWDDNKKYLENQINYLEKTLKRKEELLEKFETDHISQSMLSISSHESVVEGGDSDETLRQRLLDAQSTIQMNASIVNSLKCENAALVERYSGMMEDIEVEHTEKAAKSTRDLQLLREELESSCFLLKERDRQLADFLEQRIAMEQSIGTLTQKSNDYKRDLDHCNQQLKEIKEFSSKKEIEAILLRNDLSQAQERLHALALQNEELQRDLDVAKNQAKLFQETINRLDGENQMQEKAFTSNFEELRYTQEEIASLHLELDDLHAEISRLKFVEENSHKLSEEFIFISKELERYRRIAQSHETLTETNRGNIMEIERLQQEVLAMTTEKENMAKKIVEISLNLQSAQDLAYSKQSESDSMAKQLLEKALSHEATRNQLAVANEEILAAAEKMNQLETEVSELREKMRLAVAIKKRWKESEAKNKEFTNDLEKLNHQLLEAYKRGEDESDEKRKLEEMLINVRAGMLQLEEEKSTILNKSAVDQRKLQAIRIILEELASSFIEKSQDFDILEESPLISLVEAIHQLQLHKDTLAEELDANTSRLKSLDDLVCNQEQMIRNQSDLVSTLRKEISELNQKHSETVEGLTAENETLMNQLQSLMESGTDLESKSIHLLKGKIASLQDMTIRDQTMIIQIQTDLASTEENLSKALERIREQAFELDCAKNEIADQLEQRRLLVERLDSYSQIKIQANLAQKNLTEVKLLYEKMQHDYDCVQKSNHVLRHKLSTLQSSRTTTLSTPFESSQTMPNTLKFFSVPNIEQPNTNRESTTTKSRNGLMESLNGLPSKDDTFRRSAPISEKERAAFEVRRNTRFINSLQEQLRSILDLHHEYCDQVGAIVLSSQGETSSNISASFALQSIQVVTDLETITEKTSGQLQQILQQVQQNLQYLLLAVNSAPPSNTITLQEKVSILNSELREALRTINGLHEHNDRLNERLMLTQNELVEADSFRMSNKTSDPATTKHAGCMKMTQNRTQENSVPQSITGKSVADTQPHVSTDTEKSLLKSKQEARKLFLALQQAAKESDLLRKTLAHRQQELEKTRISNDQLGQAVRIKEKQLENVRLKLEQKEERVKAVNQEKAKIGQMVMRACDELEELVLEPNEI